MNSKVKRGTQTKPYGPLSCCNKFRVLVCEFATGNCHVAGTMTPVESISYNAVYVPLVVQQAAVMTLERQALEIVGRRFKGTVGLLCSRQRSQPH